MAGDESEAVRVARPGSDADDEQGGWDVLSEATRRGGVASVAGKLLGVVLTLFRVILTFLSIRTRLDGRSVSPGRIYSTRDIAKMLGIERRDVIGLIHAGKLKAQKTGRNYHIVGKSLIRYLRG